MAKDKVVGHDFLLIGPDGDQIRMDGMVHDGKRLSVQDWIQESIDHVEQVARGMPRTITPSEPFHFEVKVGKEVIANLQAYAEAVMIGSPKLVDATACMDCYACGEPVEMAIPIGDPGAIAAHLWKCEACGASWYVQGVFVTGRTVTGDVELGEGFEPINLAVLDPADADCDEDDEPVVHWACGSTLRPDGSCPECGHLNDGGDHAED